jgi:hypothetical protein
MVVYKFDIVLEGNTRVDRHVWHENIDVVKLFIKQHGFHDNAIHQIYPTHDPILNTDYQLKEVHLKRNSDDELITIYTTRDIIHDIIITFVEQMDVTISEIPYLITYTGHDIIRSLNDLIYKLPFVFLKHYVRDEGMDEIDEEAFVQDVQYVKLFAHDQKDNGYAIQPTRNDLCYLDYEAFNAYAVESLEYACDDSIFMEEPLPITIECYISCFIKYYSND